MGLACGTAAEGDDVPDDKPRSKLPIAVLGALVYAVVQLVADRVGNEPPALVIETETCRIEQFVTTVPSTLHVDRPFVVQIAARPPAGESSTGVCPATVTFSGAEDEITFDRRRTTADFHTGPLSLQAVPQVAGRHSLIFRIEMDSPCAESCRTSHSGTQLMVVDKDPAMEQVRHELEAVGRGLRVRVQQDDPVRTAVPTRVRVLVGPPVTEVPGVDDVVVAIRTVGDTPLAGSGGRLLSPGGREADFDIVVKPESSRDFDLALAFELAGSWQGERVAVPVQRVVRIDVTQDPIDILKENVPWVAALVGIPSALGLGAFLRRRARRRNAVPRKAPA